MLGKAHTFALDGPGARHVLVELDVRPGLPAFTIVGLADRTVREARERIRAAIRNSGYEFPSRRITVNLAPGELPKEGPGFDLAIACALLAASGQIDPGGLARLALHGELGLDGALRPGKGALAVAEAARAEGLDGIVLARPAAFEAARISGLEIKGAANLQSAVRILSGGRPDPPAPGRAPSPQRSDDGPELARVRGRQIAVRAMIVAAAGAHNILLSGPAGTGKTMLARSLPSFLPPLSPAEELEVLRIRGAAGLGSPADPARRPFRCPHHTISAAGLVGGVRRGLIGEVVLAHRGVLFLDELAEFSRPALEALRQPLEDGRVTIARAAGTSVHPARFMLLAATNPCPCGRPPAVCRCSASDLARHRRRMSGALLDRIDLQVGMGREPGEDLSAPPAPSSARALELVLQARERQLARAGLTGACMNAELGPGALARVARLERSGRRILEGARREGLLSGRGEVRLLRVARTLADLEGREVLSAGDVAEALALRCEPVGAGAV